MEAGTIRVVRGAAGERCHAPPPPPQPFVIAFPSNLLMQGEHAPSLGTLISCEKNTHSVQLLDTQFEQYISRVKTTDCQAELRRLLKCGPPIYVSDKHAFPLEEDDTHVCRLWFAVDSVERSSKLKGALEGEERDALWRDLNGFIIEVGKEDGDDVDEAEGTSKD
jgi:hypothetical protein